MSSTQKRVSRECVEEALRILVRNLLVGTDEARRNIARDLHDVFSNELVGIELKLNELRKNMPKRREAIKILGEQVRDLDHVIAQLRQYIQALHPMPLEDLGLAVALREECKAFSKRYHIPVEFTCPAVPASIRPEVSLNLHRILQEGLGNVAHHARAKRVWVFLGKTKSSLVLRISDNGCGFDPKQQECKGLGLIGMAERISAMKGTVRINSRPRQGTTVEVRVPV